MVLKLTVPKGMSLTLWIEKKAHKLFKSKHFYPLTRYLPAAKVASLLNVSEEAAFKRAEESGVFHAVNLNDTILFHPEGAWKEIVRPFREFIKKEKQRKRLTRHTPMIKRKGMNISSH